MHPRLKIVTTTLLVLGTILLAILFVIQGRFRGVTVALFVLCAAALLAVRKL